MRRRIDALFRIEEGTGPADYVLIVAPLAAVLTLAILTIMMSAS